MPPTRAHHDTKAVTMFLVRPAAKALGAAKARKPRLLSRADAAEEALEGEVQTLQDRLRLVRMHEALPSRDVASNFLQELLLIGDANAHAMAPGADALFEGRVPEVLQKAKLTPERRLLGRRRIEAKADGSGCARHVKKLLVRV